MSPGAAPRPPGAGRAPSSSLESQPKEPCNAPPYRLPRRRPEPGPVRQATAAQPGALQAGAGVWPLRLDGSCILYVADAASCCRTCARAESCNACLLHRDGGQEESLQSLGRLVDRADVVLCPIDCVSHQACLKVKALCRRRAKPFVPLRSSSATCFARALAGLQKPPSAQCAVESTQPAA